MSRKKAPSRLLTDAVREVRNTRSRFLSLLVLSALVLAALLLAAYYGLYLLVTPEECLRPSQLAQLRGQFGFLFLPSPHPGWG